MRKVLIAILSVIMVGLIGGAIYFSTLSDNDYTEYNITYMVEGGTLDSTYTTGIKSKYNNKSAYTLPDSSNITKSGYTFLGWTRNLLNINSASGSEYSVDNNSLSVEYSSSNQMSSTDWTIPVYENEIYTFKWTTNSGAFRPIVQIYNANNQNISSASLEISGLTYKQSYNGYYKDSTSGFNFVMPQGAKKIKIAFAQMSNCGSNSVNKVSNLKFYQGTFEPQSYESQIPENSSGNRTYRAVWSEIANSFAVKFYSTSESTVYETFSVEDGQTYTIPQEPTKEGFTFAGWSSQKDNTVEWTQGTKVASEETSWFAVWKKVWTFYDKDGDTKTETVNYLLDAQQNQSYEKSNPTLTNYTFEGYSLSNNTEKEITTNTISSTLANPTYYAVWSKIDQGSEETRTETFAINFNAGNGELSQSQWTGNIQFQKDYTRTEYRNYDLSSVTYGNKTYGSEYENARETVEISLPTATLNGYDFVGWDNSNNSTTATWTSGQKSFLEDSSWFAVWKTQNGTHFTTNEIKHTLYKNPTETQEVSSNVKYVYSNDTVYYNYNISTQENTEDDTTINETIYENLAFPTTYNVGTKYTINSEEYTFIGWAENQTSTNPSWTTGSKEISGSKNFYAIWGILDSQGEETREDTYEVKFETGDGTINGQSTYTGNITYKKPYTSGLYKNYNLTQSATSNKVYGEEYVYSSEPISILIPWATLSLHAFVGWTTDPNSTIATWTSGEKQFDAPTTLYVVWEMTVSGKEISRTEPFTVKFHAGEAYMDQDTYTGNITYERTYTGKIFKNYNLEQEREIEREYGQEYEVSRDTITIDNPPHASLSGFAYFAWTEDPNSTKYTWVDGSKQFTSSADWYATWRTSEQGTEDSTPRTFRVYFNAGSGTMAQTTYTGNIYYKRDYLVAVAYNYDLSVKEYGHKTYGDDYEYNRETIEVDFPTATLTDYNLIGWTTISTSLDTEWTAGRKTFTDNADFYAVWQTTEYLREFTRDENYTVNFETGVGELSQKTYTGIIEYYKNFSAKITRNYNLQKVKEEDIVYHGPEYEDYRQTLTIPFNKASSSNYDFVGWTNNSSSTTATWTSGSKEFNDNETLYAVWSYEVVVTYNANGATSGNCPSSSSENCYLNYNATKITEAEIVLAQNNLQKTGYSPNGWNTEADGQGLHYNNYNFIFADADLDLYSQWSANTYNVKYNGNGATGGNTADSVHTYDVAKNLTANGFEKKHIITYNHNYTGSTNTTGTATYTFSKWNTLADGLGTNYTDKQSVMNLTTSGTFNLYAQWISSSVVLPTPTRTGYSFAGWYSDSSCSNFVNYGGANYIPTENKTLYAKWSLSPYNITVNFKNADQMEKVVVSNDANATISASGQKFTATYTGQYKLEFTPKFGYYVTNIVVDGVSKNVTQTENNTINNTSYINLTANLFTKDTTIIVETAVKTYTVTFDGNGGLCANGSKTTIQATINDTITLPVFTYQDAVMGGWLNSNSSEAEIVVDDTITTTTLSNLYLKQNTLTFYVNWLNISYVMLSSPMVCGYGTEYELEMNEWEHDAMYEYYYKALIDTKEIPTLPEITLAGYTHYGWNLNGYLLSNNSSLRVSSKFYTYMNYSANSVNNNFAYPILVKNTPNSVTNTDTSKLTSAKLTINDGEFGIYPAGYLSSMLVSIVPSTGGVIKNPYEIQSVSVNGTSKTKYLQYFWIEKGKIICNTYGLFNAVSSITTININVVDTEAYIDGNTITAETERKYNYLYFAGMEYGSVKVRHSSTPSFLPKYPTNPGYTFKGWYDKGKYDSYGNLTADTTGTLITTSSYIDCSMTLYPHWEYGTSFTGNLVFESYISSGYQSSTVQGTWSFDGTNFEFTFDSSIIGYSSSEQYYLTDVSGFSSSTTATKFVANNICSDSKSGTITLTSSTNPKNTDIVDGKQYYLIYVSVAECFVAGTKVTTVENYNGVEYTLSSNNIEEMKAGDLVLGYNEVTKSNEVVRVKDLVIKPHKRDMARLTFSDGSVVTMTQYHPLMTSEGWKSLTNFNGYATLEIGDKVKTEDGYKELENIEMWIEDNDVVCYTLGLETLDGELLGYMTYYANQTLAQSHIYYEGDILLNK